MAAIFATSLEPWADEEWPHVVATSPWMGPKAFIAFRAISTAVFVGHWVAHVIDEAFYDELGWFYLMYLTNWALLLEVITEVVLLVLAVQGYRSLGKEPSSSPALARVGVTLTNVVQPASLLVVFLYWTLVRPLWELTAENFPPYLSVFVHLLNWGILLVGVLASRLPISLARYGWLFLFLAYLVWTVIHFVAKIGTAFPCADYPQDLCPIYSAFDWNEPTVPLIVTFASGLVVLPALLGLYQLFTRCRDGCDPSSKKRRVAAGAEPVKESA